jgi:hypothetical protein
MGILLISGGILILALATLVIRYGSARFPSPRRRGHSPTAADDED